MADRRRHGFNWLEATVVLAVALIGLAVVVPRVIYSREVDRRSNCQSNLKAIELALRQYVQDYNEFYPPVGPNRSHGTMTDRGGWAASLSSYMKNDELFECPSAPIDETISGSGRTDYGYNAELAGISPPVFNNSANNVLFFETDQNLATVQTASRSNTSRVRTARHLGGSNYVFIDGHLKWLESWRPPVTAPANGCNFTFAT